MKIIEIILNFRITSFLKANDIISDKQYAFRESKPTEDANLKLHSAIYNVLDKRTPFCIFIDLSKAFDIVCHKKLLHKLYSYGIRGKTYSNKKLLN